MAAPNDANNANNYTDGVAVNNIFDFQAGVCVLPLAEEPPTSLGELETWSPVVILRLHAPYRLRRTTYAADKSNTPPVMPSPQADSGKLKFVAGNMNVSNRLNSSFAMFDWTVVADFLYVEDCVSRTQDGFVLGTTPFLYTSSFLASQITPAITPQIGAISQAGAEARVGAAQALTVNFNSVNGYIYNIPSYLPSTFFSDDLVNGGTPPP